MEKSGIKKKRSMRKMMNLVFEGEYVNGDKSNIKKVIFRIKIKRY